MALKEKMKKVKLKDLNPAKYNPNKMSESKRKLLKQSLKHYGYIENIVVNKDLTIVDGHHRVEELIDSGVEEEDVVILDLSKDEEKALNLALRRIKGEADPKLELELVEELSLEGFNLELAGFDELELKTLDGINQEKQEVEEDNFDLESVEESICKEGDIWQLGKHRLMCGDSTSKSDVEILMDENKVDMIFTDPPYGLGGYGGRNNMELKGDTDKDITKFYECIPKDVKERYIWGNYLNLMRDIKEEPRDVIVWKKNNFGLGKGYRGQYELCFYYGEFDGSDSDVWEIKKDTKYNHPTQKPVKLPARAIQNSSLSNENILDLFGGSGSTLIACEQLNRTCYMMEIDPHYCDIIIKRWEEYTGEKAEKKN